MAEKREPISRAELVKRVAICPPALRMVILEAWSEGGVAECRALPVVAVRSSVVHAYRRRGAFYGGKASHGDFMDAGWEFCGEAAREEMICLASPDGDPALYTQEELAAGNAATLAVACPWPPEEDERRLAEHAERVKGMARQEERLSAERRARAGGEKAT
jgi:hypothetical protein